MTSIGSLAAGGRAARAEAEEDDGLCIPMADGPEARCPLDVGWRKARPKRTGAETMVGVRCLTFEVRRKLRLAAICRLD